MSLSLLTEPIDGVAEPLHPGLLARYGEMWHPVAAVCREDDRTAAGERTLRGGRGGDSTNVIVCGPCSSCLDVAYRLWADGGLKTWDAVWAVSQWAGRGQRRRNWGSPAGNLYAAWIWPRDQSIGDLIPLVAGLAVARALSESGAYSLLKWPNDIVFEGGKAGGILVESRGDCLAVGIGLNLYLAPRIAPGSDETALAPVSFAEHGIGIDPLRFWKSLVMAGKDLAGRMPHPDRRAAVLGEIESRLAWRNRAVTVVPAQADATPYRATVAGLAPDGGLMVFRGSGSETVYSAGLLPPDSPGEEEAGFASGERAALQRGE